MAKKGQVQAAAPSSPSPVEGEEVKGEEQPEVVVEQGDNAEQGEQLDPVVQDAAPAKPKKGAKVGIALEDFEPSEYPASFSVMNQTPSDLVFPVVSGDVFKPYKAADVTVNEKSQLDSFKNDVAILSEMNGWTSAFVVV